MKIIFLKRTLTFALVFAVAFTMLPILDGGIVAQAKSKKAKLAKNITVSASVTGNSATVTWNKINKPEKGYAVFRDGNCIAHLGKGSASFSDSGLDAGSYHTYQIKTYKTKVKKTKMWFNTATGQYQKKKPAKALRGKSKIIKNVTYSYKKASNVTAITIPAPIPTPANSYVPGTSQPTQNINQELSAPIIYSINAVGDSNLAPSVALYWYYIPDAEKYIVYKDNETFEVPDTEHSWVDENVVWGKTYTYKVAAVKGDKTAISKAESATIPNEPVPLTSENGVYTDVSAMYSYINEWRQDTNNHWYTGLDGQTHWLTDEDKANLKTLVRDETLEQAAKQRAKEQWIVFYEQKKSSSYKHTRPDGLPYSVTIQEFGLNPFGENIFYGSVLDDKKKAICNPNNIYFGWAEGYGGFWEQGHRRMMLSMQTIHNASTDKYSVTPVQPITKVGFAGFKVGNTEMIVMELAY